MRQFFLQFLFHYKYYNWIVSFLSPILYAMEARGVLCSVTVKRAITVTCLDLFIEYSDCSDSEGRNYTLELSAPAYSLLVEMTQWKNISSLEVCWVLLVEAVVL